MRLGHRFRLLLCAMLGFATPAVAQNSPVLVELFTSQGCAACPPADKLFEQLADREDVIALGLHVDYWDYIGWVDSFGQAQFSKRQKAYARARGRASVYTPQMIIGGMDEVKGSSEHSVMDAIREHLSNTGLRDLVQLTLTGEPGGEIVIEAIARQPLPYAVDIQLVRYIDSGRVEILAGENNGRTLLYRNIVTSWRKLGAWDGVDRLKLSAKAEGDEAVVVVIQEQGHGPVLAAARRR